MSTVLAIDPGPAESAYVLIDADTCQPLHFEKVPNEYLLTKLRIASEEVAGDRICIEMVSNYGNAVGAEVFDTCVWVGRFAEAAWHGWWPRKGAELILRPEVKRALTGDRAAKDSRVIAALVDRFAGYGTGQYGKGTKDAPGWFYGFKGDVWQAYALAVYAADLQPAKSAGMREYEAGMSHKHCPECLGALGTHRTDCSAHTA